ncbi:UTP--glucose-1-phosphate uridylyltransferase [Candidatus Microgenomates bacterium]|nr:UTP--glucose-1-phosphate uridylyltransferase [Candidatus Microgenomates bacterium]
MRIRKAIIAAAGYGTRFLPATKVQPKEMLPLIDKPIIQYLVEEVVNSGIRDIIIVTRSGSHVVADHFDSNVELEMILEATGKKNELSEVKRLSRLANFIFLRQTKDYPYGNASPLLVARDLINNGESFVYMFGDDLVKSEVPATKQLISLWRGKPKSWIVGCQEIPYEEVYKYGILKLKDTNGSEIESAIEKPEVGKAPSNLAQFGRFIFDKRIFKYLNPRELGKNNELWVIDAITRFIEHRGKVLAAKVEGEWLDTGNPLNYLKATVEFALERPDLAAPFKEFLKSTLEK